jgi:hypothetical protein
MYRHFILADESEGGIHVSVPIVPAKRPPGRPRISGRRSKKPGKISSDEYYFCSVCYISVMIMVLSPDFETHTI